ncbi:MAG: trigger factor [Betaproteobacteria bacterium]|nr:MAG: trigger factor [Betaproteobacteria bacterium]
MQSDVEILGPLERRLNVTVLQEKIESEVESRLKRLARTAKIHGFRSGKVPLKIVSQQYGPKVRQEVMGEVLHRSFGEVVLEQKLRVAGYPRFEAKEVTENTPQFEFSATFEVYPDVILGDLKSISIEQTAMQVSPADVDKAIEIMRKQRTQYDAVERPVMIGDRINIDYHGVIDGEEFDGGRANNFFLVLGEGQFLKDFEEPMLGMSTEQRKTFEVTFPVDYHNKEIAGKTATFEVKLNGVEKSRLPELNAEFAKLLGIADGDTEKMYGEVQANLEREVSKRIKTRVKEKVMQALLDTIPIETPRVLVALELDRLMQSARNDLKKRGMKIKDVPLSPDLFQEQALRRVNLGLIMAELVKTYDLHAKPEQVRALVEDFAQSYENPGEMVKWHYSSKERLNEAESAVLEDNVVAWVLQKAKVVEKVVTFDELMGKS